MRIKITLLFVALVFFALLLFSSTFMYTVSETQQAIVTKFGEFRRDVNKLGTNQPGLHFKLPFIEKVIYFDKRILEWSGKVEKTGIPTLDKRYLFVETFAKWQIVDPLVYYQRVGNETQACILLDKSVEAAIRATISSHYLIEAVRSNPNPIKSADLFDDQARDNAMANFRTGRDQIVRLILEKAASDIAQYGIRIVDVQIKRISYGSEVEEQVYRKMTTERKSIAEKYRAEGEREKLNILGDMERQEKTILSEAYRKAEEIRGKADAEAIAIYAKAYMKDPEFFKFLKTLESYEKSLTGGVVGIFSTETDFFKYFKQVQMPEDLPPVIEPAEDGGTKPLEDILAEPTGRLEDGKIIIDSGDGAQRPIPQEQLRQTGKTAADLAEEGK